MSKGKVIIFSAPSGAGKTTIVKYLIAHNPSLQFSISATTRNKRPNEEDGKDYYFMAEDTFRKKITNDEFVEYEEVYNGTLYGTLKSEIDRIRGNQQHVILDVDVQGGMNLKSYYKDEALAVFVKPPNLEILETRLRARNTETEESLQKRIAKAQFEISYENKFDVTVLNDNLDSVFVKAQQILDDFIIA